jgi:hypothetical protein
VRVLSGAGQGPSVRRKSLWNHVLVMFPRQEVVGGWMGRSLPPATRPVAFFKVPSYRPSPRSPTGFRRSEPERLASRRPNRSMPVQPEPFLHARGEL